MKFKRTGSVTDASRSRRPKLVKVRQNRCQQRWPGVRRNGPDVSLQNGNQPKQCRAQFAEVVPNSIDKLLDVNVHAKVNNFCIQQGVAHRKVDSYKELIASE
ncbi:hypothetical protein AVEN_241481-1 [Araneus ventricosus]|uniref:Uncharacterized protein n=1 Tax=Araneus ventricosus TaxID=182803 RepID=A0A4Y2FJA2_ARAVE|nr:hypothetical protein AVEN_241481-1 [Araneus ventricosus]